MLTAFSPMTTSWIEVKSFLFSDHGKFMGCRTGRNRYSCWILRPWKLYHSCIDTTYIYIYIGTIGRNCYYKLITLASMVLYPLIIETPHVTCSILPANLQYPVNWFFSYPQYCSLLGIAKQAPPKKENTYIP